MRDTQRIKRFLQVLEKIWTDNPNMRFGQLIGSTVNITDHLELYYMEDAELELRLGHTYQTPTGQAVLK